VRDDVAMMDSAGLSWIDDETFDWDDVTFDLSGLHSQTEQSTPGKFLMVKSRPMVEFYCDRLSGRDIHRVLEIGMFKGGSVVFFHKLCQPCKVVGIDIEPRPIPALTEYIRTRRLHGEIRPFYGIDQGDGDAIRRILDGEFGGSRIDLIIDDGCHYRDQIRQSFNATYPYLRDGGIYVIEDWGWAHWPGIWQDGGGPWKYKASPSTLLFELTMTAASRPDIVREVTAMRELAFVRKGSGALLGADFDVSRSYLAAGRAFSEAGINGCSKLISESGDFDALSNPQRLEKTRMTLIDRIARRTPLFIRRLLRPLYKLAVRFS
jgi:SAM-dependent methyltransferase